METIVPSDGEVDPLDPDRLRRTPRGSPALLLMRGLSGNPAIGYGGKLPGGAKTGRRCKWLSRGTLRDIQTAAHQQQSGRAPGRSAARDRGVRPAPPPD